MRFTNIKILGEDLALFALPTEDGFLGAAGASALLMPSLVSDFKVIAYSNGVTKLYDSYSAALGAAAFLIEKRGLPLRELTFETVHENIEIIHTGPCEYSFKLCNCKHLCTNSTVVMGCGLDYTDVFCSAHFRIVYADDIELFNPSVLRELVTAWKEVPASVIAVGKIGELYRTLAYTEHAKAKPSLALIHAAAAYSEFIRAGKRIVHFLDECRCESDFSSVTLSHKPKF